VFRGPVAVGGIFAGRKVTIGPEGQNFADLIALVYRLPAGDLAVVLQRLHG
jgi:hypothetical protein